MVKIYFEASSFSRNAPGIPLEGRMIEVPEQGELKQICTKNYLDVKDTKPQKTIIPEFPSICRRFKEGSGNLGRFEGSEDIYLVWIDKRNEWIAINHDIWVEDAYYGDDESESGPFALNDYCKEILFETYKIPKEKVMGDISKMSPDRLEELAKTK